MLAKDSSAVAAPDFSGRNLATLLVFDDFSQSTSRDILAETVTSTGVQGGTVIVANDTASLERPRVSYSIEADRFLVAYESGTDLAAKVLPGDLSGTVATLTVSALAGSQQACSLTHNRSTNQWLVAFESDHGTSVDVYGQRIDAAGSFVGGLTTLAGGAGVQGLPAAAWAGATNTFLVAYENWFIVNTDADIWAQETSATLTTVGAAFQVSSALIETQQLAPELESNSVQKEWLAAWQDQRALSDYDLWGQRISSGAAPCPIRPRSRAPSAARRSWTRRRRCRARHPGRAP